MTPDAFRSDVARGSPLDLPFRLEFPPRRFDPPRLPLRSPHCPAPTSLSDAPLADTSDFPVNWPIHLAARRHRGNPPPLAGPEPQPVLLPTLPASFPHRLPREHRAKPAAGDTSFPGRREPTDPICQAGFPQTPSLGTAPAGEPAPSAPATSPARLTDPPPESLAPCGVCPPDDCCLPDRPFAGTLNPGGRAAPHKSTGPATLSLPASDLAVPRGTITGNEVPCDPRSGLPRTEVRESTVRAAKTAIAPVRAGNYVRFDHPLTATSKARSPTDFCA